MDGRWRLDDLPDVLTVDEVRQVLRLSRSSTYELIKRGDLPARRVGGSLRITRRALLEFLDLED